MVRLKRSRGVNSDSVLRTLVTRGLVEEQGRLEQYEHEALGRTVAAGDWAGVAVVPCKPAGMAAAAAPALVEGLRAAGWPGENLHLAEDAAGAAAWLRARLRPGDALLLKASRGVRIEHVLDALRKEG